LRPDVDARAVGRPSRRRRTRGTLEGFLFLLPNLVLFLGLVVIPILIGVGLSFFDWDLLSSPSFLGLDNYRELAQDEVALASLKVTLIIIVGSVAPTVLISFLLANVLNAVFRLRALVRLAYLSPIFISTVAAAVLWRYVFSPQGGITYLVDAVGLPAPDWLVDTTWAVVATMIVVIWKSLPIATLFYLAALQGVPSALHEAARLDGANVWQRIRYINWPACAEVTALISVLTLIGVAFGSFDVVAVLTQGGPLLATNVLPYYAYTSAFIDFRFGYAAAVSSVLCAIVLAVTVVIIVRQQRRSTQ
jgi:multiple sugar transport system permease protein